MALEEAAEAEAQADDLVLHRLRLQKALPEVRGRLREILRLAMEGLNHREIAIRMGVSRVAITRRLTRFRKELAAVGLEREAAFARSSRPPAPAPEARPARPARGALGALAVPRLTGRSEPVPELLEPAFAA
jgi:DNA-binding CsgD family transcriptional regulator